ARRYGMEMAALSLAGESGGSRLQVNDHALRYTGYGGSRIRYALDFHKLTRHAKLVWIAHPFLSPLLMLPGAGTPKYKSAVHAHGIEVWERLPFLRRRALMTADVLTASSQYTAGKVSSLQGVEEGRIHVLHPALDPGFPIIDHPGQRDRGILIVSRMNRGDRDKGVELALRAFARLPAGCQDWVCHVVGDGDDRERLEKVAGELGASERVTFHGRVSDEELSRLYKSSGIFCLPSAKEGFGIVYLEAMALGLPILGLRAAAVPEVVDHEVTGLLSEPGDVDVLAKNMEDLISKDELRTQYGMNGIAKVGTHGLDQFQSRMDNILEPLLEMTT
ncbi:MAG: glycosyltransferase family 4 protein, partial [Candidatus Sumerlaeia bacterium]|nr:glycosyltransferase family 4 protein [Candidatus Sumerlaeia bacterium]